MVQIRELDLLTLVEELAEYEKRFGRPTSVFLGESSAGTPDYIDSFTAFEWRSLFEMIEAMKAEESCEVPVGTYDELTTSSDSGAAPAALSFSEQAFSEQVAA